MEMETVKLSHIVKTYTPELYTFLTRTELNSEIVLVNGIQSLDQEDVIEIVQFSINENRKDAFLQ
ncbi:hypothetical protein HMPREF1207_04214 [Paenibacillus sp. HGH0039]|nr:MULTISPECIES: hypothetical protein [Paenibacillus]EPD82387.1 hypothetical protein HMPREF1207_04214 [Paenibacillus sp. HGH0039]MBV6714323.1 hypothetical protein [Paenibacillus chitinolyticus]